MGAASDEWTLSDALRDGPEAERDCELGYISSAPEVLYQHTLDPSLSGATDLLSLIRNTVVALLARSGLIVELVFSSDFRWIYALISAGESALEELAAKHSYPRALDLECVDPEATEPCDAQYDPLSLVFQRHGCQEVVELLRALRPEERSSEATVPKGSSTPEDSVRDAYCWYLRSRLKGGKSAAIAKKEALASWAPRRIFCKAPSTACVDPMAQRWYESLLDLRRCGTSSACRCSV
ncbi:unnamed protein product [Durusdinium trenchii]|uniref:Uncharacterized protein n=1 Tax=Durusdinium trenchii TaxID=1381693 RepID=A0ABP0T0B9_9DINO